MFHFKEPRTGAECGKVCLLKVCTRKKCHLPLCTVFDSASLVSVRDRFSVFDATELLLLSSSWLELSSIRSCLICRRASSSAPSPPMPPPNDGLVAEQPAFDELSLSVLGGKNWLDWWFWSKLRFFRYLPSDSRFGVLEAVPSPIRSSAGLVGGGGVCMREPDGFRLDIGAEMDGRRLTRLNGRPSSESRSPAVPAEGGIV